MTASRPRPPAQRPASRRSNAAPGHDADGIFERLRDAIVNRHLAPGTQLKEQPLADAFAVSRAVIRQVLTRLQGCRLAEHQHNRGVFVAAPTPSECQDIFAARRVIEVAIVRAVIERIDSAGLTELKACVRQEAAAAGRRDEREATRLSLEFHDILARIAGNHVLRLFLAELVARTPLVLFSVQQSSIPICSRNDHAHIAAAIEAGDVDEAVQWVDAHLDHLEAKLAIQHAAPAPDIDLARILDAPKAR